MFFPLRDELPSRSFPILTIGIILINIGIFVYQAWFGLHGFEFYVNEYGLVPAAITGNPSADLMVRTSFPFLNFFTAMFMHGGIGHLLGNMWFLWIFGDNIEDVLGKKKFIFFYLLTGVLASVAHIAKNPGSGIPLVGASGAIAGVLGAYFVLFPRQRVLTLAFLGFYVTTFRLRAVWFLGIWFLFQLLNTMVGGYVAWWAHVGGFVSGMVLILILKKRSGSYRRVS